MPVLTFVDTLGIQSFVFASNRLKDVVGGSELVYQATSRDGWIQQLKYQTELIVGAGGNLLLKFDTCDEAKTFAAQFSHKLLNEAPGLEVALVHHEYQNGSLAKAIQAIQIKIERQKFERCPSVPLLGLGVTATCRETRLPATSLDVEGIPISEGIAKRREDKNQSQERWLKYLPCNDQNFQRGNGGRVDLAFPMELDDLGRSRGDISLMGVVHADGNGIGQKLKKWLDGRVENGSKDEEVRTGYQEISKALDRLSGQVFKKLLKRIVDAIQWDDRDGYVLRSASLQQSFKLRCEKDRKSGKLLLSLPIRPILLGGDDFTFVCDGRIALDLATTALTEFEQTNPPDGIDQVRACAGVALVKTHAPFARAYKLAESLCISAKSWLRAQNKENQSALDWHIGLSSPTETLQALRQRQYTAGGNQLTCRPYPLSQCGRALFEPNWNWLAKDVLGAKGNGFRTSDPSTTPNWQAHRSKLKTLREIVREGRDEVRNALEAWKVAHPKLALPDNGNMKDGFIAARTPLLDAIELLDIHFPLG